LAVSEAIAAQNDRSRLFVTYYRNLQNWAEREAVSQFHCPRMTFAGSKDVIVANGETVRIGPTIAEHRQELEQMGWTVRVLDGVGHEIGAQPHITMPLVREFLDPILL
jgi:hypothetical protein